MRLDAFENAGVNGVVDRRSREATDLEQIAALRLELCHLLDFLISHGLEVDDDPVGAGLGDDAVERHHDNAGIAGLFDRAVQGVGRRGIDDDRVITLQNQVLDLRRLGRHVLVGRGEYVGGSDDLVGDRLLGDDLIALEHRLAPGVTGIVVRKRDLLAARVGQSRPADDGADHGAASHEPNPGVHEISSLGSLLADLVRPDLFGLLNGPRATISLHRSLDKPPAPRVRRAAARVTTPSGEMPRYRAGKNVPKSRISIERCSCILLKAAPCAMGASLRRLLQRERPMSFYDATVPAYIQILPSLSGLLTKAEAHCETKKIQPEVLLGSRLY